MMPSGFPIVRLSEAAPAGQHDGADTSEEDGTAGDTSWFDLTVKADEDEAKSGSHEDEKPDFGSDVHSAASRSISSIKAADVQKNPIRAPDQAQKKLDAPRALRALRLLFQPLQHASREVVDLDGDSGDEQTPSDEGEQDGQDAFLELLRATVTPVLESIRTRFDITTRLRFSTPAEINASYDRTIGRLAELIEETRNIELERCFPRARDARQETLEELRAEHAHMLKVRASADGRAAADGDDRPAVA